MALTADEQGEVTGQYAREALRAEPCAFTKAQLAAAVAAVDGWVEANQAGFNSALPAAFRNNATAAQKAMLLTFVVSRRVGRLAVEG